MAFMEDVSDRGLGWPLGIGLIVAAVSAGPKMVRSGRPLIKRAIKGYLTLQTKGKEMFAESTEHLQDIYAEAKHEFDEEVHAMPAEQEQEAEPMKSEEKPAEGGKPARRSKKVDVESEAS